MATKNLPKRELENIQIILDKLAHRQITEEEAESTLKEIWEQAYREPLTRKILRSLLPSLSRPNEA